MREPRHLAKMKAERKAGARRNIVKHHARQMVSMRKVTATMVVVVVVGNSGRNSSSLGMEKVGSSNLFGKGGW